MANPSTVEQGKAPRLPRMRVQAGLAFVQRVRLALYALLVGSALLSFWAGSDHQRSRMPTWVEVAAPILFGAFLLMFAVYRLALIRARHYPASTGLFQIGLGALVFVLLLPGPRHAISARARAVQSGDDVAILLESADPRVRAVAAEVAGARGSGPRYASVLADRLDDTDGRVRAAARASIAKLLGTDLPPDLPEEAAAIRLRAELTTRGWLHPQP